MEKKKLIIHRVVWLGFVLLGIFLPSIVEYFKPKLEIVDYECYVEEYYEYSNETSCDVEITFNRPLSIFGDNEVRVSFYDKTGKLIDVVEEMFFIDESNDKIATNNYLWIKGEVDSFEIEEHSFEPQTCVWPYLTLCISIPMLIAALLLSYKEIEYKGKKISVYAGFYHHTLRINGELCDEHNTLVTWSAIKLSTTTQDDESEPDKIEATISLTNRIAIKVNDKILKDKHIQ